MHFSVYRCKNDKHLLGSPSGYSLERETSAKLTEGCRLRRAKMSSEARLRGEKAGSFIEGAVSLLTEGVNIFPFQLFCLCSIPTFFTQNKSLNLTFLSARRRGVSFPSARKKPKCRSGGKRTGRKQSGKKPFKADTIVRYLLKNLEIRKYSCDFVSVVSP